MINIKKKYNGSTKYLLLKTYIYGLSRSYLKQKLPSTQNQTCISIFDQ